MVLLIALSCGGKVGEHFPQFLQELTTYLNTLIIHLLGLDNSIPNSLILDFTLTENSPHVTNEPPSLDTCLSE